MKKNEIKDDSVRDWSALPTDLLEYMTKKFPLLEDFMAFRGVCTSWRAVATRDKFAAVSKVPLLMLPAKKGGSDVREFYSLSSRKICMRMPLPDAMNKRCIYAGFGWILTLSAAGDVCLLKPFSPDTAKIKLPNLRIFPEHKKFQTHPVFFSIRKAVLTANPSETSDFCVFITGCTLLGFCRNGGEKWVRMDTESNTMTLFKGKVYAMNFDRYMVIWDPQETDLTKPQSFVRLHNAPSINAFEKRFYLVGSTDGELLLIEKNGPDMEDYFLKGADHFRVMRLDLVTGDCIEINDLGKDAIFVGDNVSAAVVAAEFPGVIKPNCIYFTDDCYEAYYQGWFKGGGKDMGIYNLEDKSIERFNVKSLSRMCPPLWTFPSF